MNTEPLRLLGRVVLTIIGVIGGLFCYFVCQGMFAGYPRYHTGLLSTLGMLLVAACGGVAWIVDERRIREHGFDDD